MIEARVKKVLSVICETSKTKNLFHSLRLLWQNSIPEKKRKENSWRLVSRELPQSPPPPPTLTPLLSIPNQAVLLQLFLPLDILGFSPYSLSSQWLSGFLLCLQALFKVTLVMFTTFPSPRVSSKLNELVNIC